MYISNIGSTGKASGIKGKKPSKAKGAFSDHFADNIHESSTVAGAEDVTPVNSLFMLQEINEEGSPLDKAVSEGFDILEYLDTIRLSILNGKVSETTLTALEKQIRQMRQNIDDPKLLEILEEIELRASVELAKLRR